MSFAGKMILTARDAGWPAKPLGFTKSKRDYLANSDEDLVNDCGDRTDQGLSIVGHTRYCMGVSENSVPLNPMVNDHYPY